MVVLAVLVLDVIAAVDDDDDVAVAGGCAAVSRARRAYNTPS